MSVTVKVRVPGTTANCGPGFDAIGIACNIYNEVSLTLTPQGGTSIRIIGEGIDSLPQNEENLIFQAVRSVIGKTDKKGWGVDLTLTNRIPLARGLGSSAAAIVGGLVAANEATGCGLTPQELLALATEWEGHPDNVAPALFGGITVSIMEDGQPRCLRFMPPKPLQLIVAVPNFPLKTEKARSVLPATVSFSDATFNVSRTALLVAALSQGRYPELSYALADRLHQPYRETLIPGMQTVFTAARQAGALGTAISGAGPCLIAFAEQSAEAIGLAMRQAFAQHAVDASYFVLTIDTEGAKVIS